MLYWVYFKQNVAILENKTLDTLLIDERRHQMMPFMNCVVKNEK